MPVESLRTTTTADANPAVSGGEQATRGEDTKQQPILKNLPDGQRMRYMPVAYFGDDLERYVRAHGYLGRGLTNFNFEVDENDKPWWVITVFTPTIVWNGEKTDGILLVDPVSGSIDFYALGQIPEWVDRVIPAEYIKSYLAFNGEYASGWWRSWWGTPNITKPEEPVLIYGSEGKSEFVTGMTSHNNNDDSLVALVYTDSRTGKPVRYKVSGGATDTAVIRAVNSNANVQFRHLHATVPQVYNVYGNMTCVVVLLNDFSGAFDHDYEDDDEDYWQPRLFRQPPSGPNPGKLRSAHLP